MDSRDILFSFFRASMNDSRLTKAHVAVFTALLYVSFENGNANPVKVYSRDVMPFARISSSATYHRALLELAEYGYLGYEASYYQGCPSKVWWRVG
ncbi:hypothetical protein EG028_19680 [Chitinophaga barathri]|uniref:Transcriptional regulator n=1 Tax=Chitinophaga barathri TaxID=1647451 RepID=A0A3N4M7S0_9BACT|nr:hypothetical protein EG028_19680 [Chitinophaga barathri]